MQSLYWSGQVSAARALADSALGRNPNDVTLRLGYGRMLAEIGDHRRAREVVEPVLRTEWRAHALATLGASAYWQGDIATARARLTEALRLDATLAEARQQLGEILVATAPRILVGASGRTDDQPLSSLGAEVELRGHATPGTMLGMRIRPMRFVVDDTGARTVTDVGGTLSHYLPTLRVRLDLGAGAVSRSRGGTDPTGHLAVSRRVSNAVTMTGRVERSAYLYTQASLSTPVTTDMIAGIADVAHRGWLSQVAANVQRYADDNTVATAYGWLLAPLARSTAADLHLGYAFAAQDARESRAQARGTGGVRYIPYYTPSNLVSHAATGALRLALGSHATFRLNGSWGMAREDAPFFTPGPGNGNNASRGFARREYNPRSVRVGIVAESPDGLVFDAYAERSRTAFYTATTGRLQVGYIIGVASRRTAKGY